MYGDGSDIGIWGQFWRTNDLVMEVVSVYGGRLMENVMNSIDI